MSRVGLLATAHYLPERWLTAAEVGAASDIPEDVIVAKFGLRGKHVAAEDEHASDLAVAAATRLLDEQRLDPASIGAVVYYGSTWKDYPVWQAAPWIAHRLGCERAYAIEYDNVSMGTPVALRLAKAYLTAEPDLGSVLVVAASRESYLLDYANERSRFMFNFGDGAVAGLLTVDAGRNLLLGSHAITNGSFALQVKVPAGGDEQDVPELRLGGQERAREAQRHRRPHRDVVVLDRVRVRAAEPVRDPRSGLPDRVVLPRRAVVEDRADRGRVDAVLLEEPVPRRHGHVGDVLVLRRDVLPTQAELLDDHVLRDATRRTDLRRRHPALGEIVGCPAEPDSAHGLPVREPRARVMMRPSSSRTSAGSSVRPFQRIQRMPTSSPMPISAQARSSGSPSAISPASIA
jgi:3-oxoacyl-[acyl-carrier-protein] synthase III